MKSFKNKICINNNDKSIFNSITEVDDEEINLFNNDSDNEEDKIPSTISTIQLIEKYVKFNSHSHLSILTLLNFVLKLDDNNVMDNNTTHYNDDDVLFYFYKIFIPKYSSINTISIV